MTVRAVLAVVHLAMLVACGPGSDRAPADGSGETDDRQSPAGVVHVALAGDWPGLRDMLVAFAAETGIRYDVVTPDAPHAGEPDITFARSFGSLWTAAEADRFRPLSRLAGRGPASPLLADGESRWFALGQRPLLVAYSERLVAPDEIATVNDYASLRDVRWRRRLCLTSSTSPGNRLLVAFLIHRYGERQAERIIREWRANLAAPPVTDNIALLAAIADGRCAIGIVDGELLGGAQGSGVLTRHFESPGATIHDISGAGVMRHAASPALAERLLAYALTPVANALATSGIPDTAAGADVPQPSSATRLPRSSDSPVALAELGFLYGDAVRLIERTGY